MIVELALTALMSFAIGVALGIWWAGKIVCEFEQIIQREDGRHK